MLALVVAPPETPPGFKPVSERVALGRDHRRGENYVVTRLDDRLRIETWVQNQKRIGGVDERTVDGGRGRDLGPERKIVPIKLGDTKIGLGPGWGLSVAGGWLSAWDFGEFGGGLLFVSEQPGAITIVDRTNTVLLARTSKGIFAVQGLTHMDENFGRLIQVLEPNSKERSSSSALVNSDAGWQIRVVADLHHTPHAVTQDGDRFLFARDRAILALETDGRQYEIYHATATMGVRSMTRLSDGNIWAGATGAILRLRPQEDRSREGAIYLAQWFVPLAARASKSER